MKKVEILIMHVEDTENLHRDILSINEKKIMVLIQVVPSSVGAGVYFT